MLVSVFEQRDGVTCLLADDTITVEHNGGGVTFRRCEQPDGFDVIHPDDVHPQTPLDIKMSLRALCGQRVDGTAIEPLLKGAECWAGDGRTGLRVEDAFFTIVMVEPERVIPITRYVPPYSDDDLRLAGRAGES